MRFPKMFALNAMVLAAVLLVPACGGSQTTEAKEEKDEVLVRDGRLIVGFSQIGSDAGWRAAANNSIRSEAEKRNINLQFAVSERSQDAQIRTLRKYVRQKVDVISFVPNIETGWEPVLQEIKAAGIPVVLAERGLKVEDETLYLSLVGADFVEEGRRAAEWFIKNAPVPIKVAEIQGNAGSDATNGRRDGFKQVADANEGIEVIMAQTGNFNARDAKEVMKAFLASRRGGEINAVYCHNDAMAFGVIEALKEAGKVPGKDILVVSIDATRPALEAIVAGDMNATVECNPLLGPDLFDVIEKVAKGEEVPRRVIVEDQVFDITNAAEALPNRTF